MSAMQLSLLENLELPGSVGTLGDVFVDRETAVCQKTTMKGVNFYCAESHEVVVEGLHLDVHNCFDFRSFHRDVTNRMLELKWRRSEGSWVDAALPKYLSILFFDVFHMSVKPRDPEMPFTEDDCLESFGYDADEECADGHMPADSRMLVEDDWRWSFLFQSGEEIIVGADSAEAAIIF